MKVVSFERARKTSILDQPKPKLFSPHDAILRVTTSGICGSDLEDIRRSYGVEKGTVVGHEIMGVIDQVGEAVDGIQEGDPWFCFLTLPAAAASTAIADTRRLVSP